MKIICTNEERNNLMEVITAGCCWIGNDKKVDIEKFKMATNFIYKKNDQVIEWEIVENKKNKPEKPKSDPFDPYKRNYYASKGFYQQLHAADMMGYKSEGTLVKYRKNGVLKENIHWIRTMGRGISYKPEACKLAIQKARNEK